MSNGPKKSRLAPRPCEVYNCRGPAFERGRYFAGVETDELWLCEEHLERAAQNRQEHRAMLAAILPDPRLQAALAVKGITADQWLKGVTGV